MSMTVIDLEQINKLEGQARFEAIEKARQALAELSPLS